MDKSWMSESRLGLIYRKGVEEFLNFAFSNTSTDVIPCPCKNCVNSTLLSRDEVRTHLVVDGIMNFYTVWTFHGEARSSATPSSSAPNIVPEDAPGRVDVYEMLHDAFGMPGIANEPAETSYEPTEGRTADADKFFKLLEDGDRKLYPGCTKFTKLSFIVRLYHIKCLSGWSNKSLDMLLTLLKEALPEGETLPKSFYEMKKIIKDLGLDYKKIDACPNDCMLYWKESVNDQACKVCGISRWKQFEQGLIEVATSSTSKGKKVAEKILRHFPLIPRLQRLFMSSKTASSMRWHDDGRSKDGYLRHPADSLAWKDFDAKYGSFSLDSRNVRLGLATDGFNPFGTMSISHSTWPVILTVYNLPPWMCMKQPYLLLSLVIPGPYGPGNDIDVYLQPLIDELKQLWEFGVITYDAHSNQNFHMKATLLWTISDFPGYAMLSGWSTKGRLACPCCNKDTCSRRLKHGRKFCYMGHRRFLDPNHRFRSDRRSFDGEQEFRAMPIPSSGVHILEQLEGINITFGKNKSRVTLNRKRGREIDMRDFFNWKKKSIFFDLPYWKHNMLRHSLDVMHIEKNVCDNIIGTLLNIEGKTKDNLNARMDLYDMGIRSKLHPVSMGNRTYLPPACFTMSLAEKDNFCSVLKKVKVPDGYAANISRCVHLKERKISGLKSHDCHVLMQQLLPIAIRGTLAKPVSAALIGLCTFFRELCSKMARVDDFERLQSRIALTLCNLERIFPPSFFDVMEHLPAHLATEASIAGPVQYRWMYPIERYLLILKKYVRNRSRPEGSIAEGYLAEECLTFCSRYFDGVETRFDRPIRNGDFGEPDVGRPLGKIDFFTLERIEWRQAHRYMLFNFEALVPYIEQHRRQLKLLNRRINPYDLDKLHNQQFDEWIFKESQRTGNHALPEEVKKLAKGPDNVARRYSAYIINGFKFHTKSRERRRKTQNSGVVVVATTTSFASASDRNPVEGDITYYGVLNDIIELNYYGWKHVVLFKCGWVNVTRGIKKDDLGFTLVNLSHLSNSGVNEYDEPFVLASQAMQVFYVNDPIDLDWHVAVQTKPRDLFDMGGDNSTDDIEDYLQSLPFDDPSVVETLIDGEEIIAWDRSDVQGRTIDAPLTLIASESDGDGLESELGDISSDKSESEFNGGDDLV